MKPVSSIVVFTFFFVLSLQATTILSSFVPATAYAQESGHEGGEHGKGKEGSGHGPNPSCPYQDGSGRGGFGPGAGGGRHEGGSHGGQGGHEGEDDGLASRDTGAIGGGMGGEGFVCDSPGNWTTRNKVYGR